MNLFIINQKDKEQSGLIGILRVPTGYPAHTYLFQVKDTANNTHGFKIGDTFDVKSHEIEKYYPPNTPRLTILEDELKDLEAQIEHVDDSDSELMDYLDYVEFYLIPQKKSEMELERKKTFG